MEYSIPSDIMDEIDSTEFGMEHGDIDRTILTVVRASQPAKEKKIPDPITHLKKVMHDKKLRNTDLKIYIGSSGNVSAVLNRKLGLSLKMIRNLHKYLHIPAEILIQPYERR